MASSSSSPSSSSASRPSPYPCRSTTPLFTPTEPLHSKQDHKPSNPLLKNNNHVDAQPAVVPAAVHFTKCHPTPRRRDKHKNIVSTTTLTTISTRNNRRSYSTSTTSSPASFFVNPKTILHSILLRKYSSPKQYPTSPPLPHADDDDDDATDYLQELAEVLSIKLIYANRRCEQALLEASRLRHSLSELQRNLNRLQSSSSSSSCLKLNSIKYHPTFATFSTAVVEARAAVRALTRALSLRIVRSPNMIKLVYMEALLNRVFYESFEKSTSSSENCRILDPAVRCQTNLNHYEAVCRVGWEDVLSRGTKYYSEGLSRFCDEKMSEVVGMMTSGWAMQASWEESLLEAFFGAAKGVWVVYLLAGSVHPAVPVMRVEKGVAFDGRFMEEEEEEEERGDVTCPVVRMMVAPGFYFYVQGADQVVKCKVACGSV